MFLGVQTDFQIFDIYLKTLSRIFRIKIKEDPGVPSIDLRLLATHYRLPGNSLKMYSNIKDTNLR